MSNIKHHLTDELLMSYAAGSLDEGFSLVVATHVSMCDDCRARSEAYEAVGGAMVDQCEVVQLSDHALDQTFALIDAMPDKPDAPWVENRSKDDVFPTPLQDYVGGDLDKVKWRSLGGGVMQAVLKTAGEDKVRLLRIPGGTAMPDHGHRGLELTMVLKGAFEDDDGHFGRGDVHRQPKLALRPHRLVCADG